MLKAVAQGWRHLRSPLGVVQAPLACPRASFIRRSTGPVASSSRPLDQGPSPPGVAPEAQRLIDEEERRMGDHRAIGKSQKLFMTHRLSPGNVFLLPHGTVIYNRLVALLRSEYMKLGYQEVRTPLIYKKELWVQSGHWDHYKNDMFLLSMGDRAAEGHPAQHIHGEGCSHGDSGDQGSHGDQAKEDNTMGLKPMNCPGHCLIFSSTARSYRELPMRLADFSPLHRNEFSGALTGLTRLRKFHQDDAHIFCTIDQIEAEIQGCLSFIERVYSIFGFEFSLTLSTRPESYMGKLEEWDHAERSLQAALGHLSRSWTVSEGDGAFYGPKIDIMLRDSLGRQHQTATIQLDFQLPQRFDLKYTDEHGSEKRPVMVHRAILGSVERMFAILIEHTGGKWPLWLSPRQVCVIPVGRDFEEDAKRAGQQIREAGFEVEVTNCDESFGKRIREAQLAGFNYMAILGKKERDSGTLSLRTREEKSSPSRHLTASMADFLDLLRRESVPRSHPS